MTNRPWPCRVPLHLWMMDTSSNTGTTCSPDTSLGWNPDLQRVQGSLITTYIGEVAVEMSRDMEAKYLERQEDKEKGIMDLLGSNLTYLLHLGQVAPNENPHPMWRELVRAPKHQHLTTIQRNLDDIARHLTVRAPIFATPGLLKIILDLGLRLYHRDDLGTGLHQFEIGQHISVTQKVLKAHAVQHQVIVGGGGAPFLADAATLMAPDGVSLPSTLAMEKVPKP